MKKLKFITCFTLFIFGTQLYAQYAAVKDLTTRQFPWLKNKVVLKEISKENDEDVFVIETKKDKLYISASSTSAASRGLDWYAKHVAHQSISHMGDNKSQLAKLPQINQPIKKKSFVPYRYALNYCTINYSFSFYTWEEWEKELDWMALNGVNIMLAPVGTEKVWYNTLIKMGYSDEEAKAFIPGPAFTAWWLMGNLEGWGGPVSNQLIDQQAELQKKILKRMKELGIEPILQGFYGMVPHDLKTKKGYEDAPVIDQGNWVFTEFTRPAILVPTTSHFENVANIYYDEMKKLYGNDIKYFGGEPFHEGGKTKGVNVPEVAQHVQQTMQKNYPNSTWVLQGWQNNPSDDILKGLKKENTLIIELFGENTDNWYKRKGYNGTSFIWSNVSNFGEKNGLYGKLQRFIDEVYRAKNSEYGQYLKGVGIIPEGIINNPVAYDLMLDLAWQDEKPNLDEWLKNYTIYRYGKENQDIINAWKGFAQTVYSSPEVYQEGPSESIYCARPSLNVNPVSSWGTRKRNYDIKQYKEAVKLFVKADEEFKNVETYQTDKIDFLRQVWADKGDDANARMVAAINYQDKERIQKAGNNFIEMVKLQNELLGNSKYFTLNRWVEEAKDFGKNLPDAQNVMYNAKGQITFWGPDTLPRTTLRDYAHKEWNGLLGSLYLERWKVFVENSINGKISNPEDFYKMEVEWSKKQDLYQPKKSTPEEFKKLQAKILE
ncbi:alpha-N-acetylglucosaminidase [Empedobacter sp. UBA7620]|uniref:alpha-N-acetylglucosaminidase n=1 Tax=Empedobacter sp. UBA7620 TaxID=1946452 RepID=UPI0025B87147|nr:alpha-N-acetylglucosaminidase [Empedobacter sp. UBA7620]